MLQMGLRYTTKLVTYYGENDGTALDLGIYIYIYVIFSQEPYILPLGQCGLG